VIKAIGFNLGQFGDLCMNVVPAKAFKNMYPNSYLTFNLSKRYEAIKEIFYHNKYIDEVKIWDGYNDNWPSEDYIRYLLSHDYDTIFDPMIGPRAGWQRYHHQTVEMCKVHNLTPVDSQIEFNQYFEIQNGYDKYIAVCHTGATDISKKSLNVDKIKKITELITKLGFKPLFFQYPFENFEYFNGKFFDAIKIMLGCKMLITIDSAMAWIASGYKFPTLGLYNAHYYLEHGAITSKNWQPINPNSIYLENIGVNNIEEHLIEDGIKNIC